MKNGRYTSMVRRDGSIMIPAPLRARIAARPGDLATLTITQTGELKITIHHIASNEREDTQS